MAFSQMGSLGQTKSNTLQGPYGKPAAKKIEVETRHKLPYESTNTYNYESIYKGIRDKKQLPSIGKRYVGHNQQVSEGLDAQRSSNQNFGKAKKYDKLGTVEFNSKYGFSILK